MIKTTLNKLFDKKDLTFWEAEEVANLLMNGQVNGSQTASLLTALRIKVKLRTKLRDLRMQ